MGGIGQESLLGMEGASKSGQKVVDPRHQHTSLAMQAAVRDRGKVVLIARFDFGGQIGQRLQSPGNTEPGQENGDAQQSDLGRGHAEQDFPRQCGALHEGLADFDCNGVFGCGAGNGSHLRRGKSCGDEPHALPIHRGVRHPDSPQRNGFGIGKCALTGEVAVACGAHSKVGLVDLIELEDLQGGARQIELDPPVLGAHRLGQGAGGVDQPTVVDDVGKIERGEVASDGVQCEQYDQYDPQPQKQTEAQASISHPFRTPASSRIPAACAP